MDGHDCNLISLDARIDELAIKGRIYEPMTCFSFFISIGFSDFVAPPNPIPVSAASSLPLAYSPPPTTSSPPPAGYLSAFGLSYDTNEPVLRDSFGQHGDIIEVKVICDHVTGKSRGYGFVRFVSDTTAAKARQEMNGQILDGRRIRVSYAHKG
ncbi:hypothetical protein Fmac_022152 [Flemingia macrophylla]|uniref:RRM domain-containing protein n=1 Tax=Flemingia macrophylla TaxID=520843 RepID=A0ABD1LYX1_9FABA